MGNPLADRTLVGPLIDGRAFDAMRAALAHARSLGAKVNFGEREDHANPGYYVRPAIVKLNEQAGPMLQETFAPMLYVVPDDRFDDASMRSGGLGGGYVAGAGSGNPRRASAASR